MTTTDMELDRPGQTGQASAHTIPVPAVRHAARNWFAAAVFLALLLFPLVQFVTETNINYYLTLMLTIFMYVAMASSWNIIGGYTGYVSLGHAVFWGVGGYVVAMILKNPAISPYLEDTVPRLLFLYLSAPIGGLAALGLGFLFGFVTLRVRGSAFIIATIALLLMFRLGFENWEWVGGANGITLSFIRGIPVEMTRFPYYYGFLLTAAGSLWLAYAIKHSKLGLGLRAISQDEVKAESAGIPTNTYKILAFALSAFFIGVAGAMWGQNTTNLKPSALFTVTIAASLVLMCILGGKGTIVGPIIGAIFLVGLEEFFVATFGSTPLNIAGTGLLMIVVLLFFPDGIIGSLRRRKLLPAILDWD